MDVLPSAVLIREIPGANTNTHELFTFFQKNFGFNQRQTVAIMGAHTLGVLQRKNSGINGPNGWVINKHRFDNEYYHHLIGGRGRDASSPGSCAIGAQLDEGIREQSRFERFR
jgi:hypothetical protein